MLLIFFPLQMRLGEVLVMENPPQTDFSGLGLLLAADLAQAILGLFGLFLDRFQCILTLNVRFWPKMADFAKY